MKIGGFLLLFSGGCIVFAALTLLHGSALSVFVVAGLAVDLLGLGLVATAHLPTSEDHG